MTRTVLSVGTHFVIDVSIWSFSVTSLDPASEVGALPDTIRDTGADTASFLDINLDCEVSMICSLAPKIMLGCVLYAPPSVDSARNIVSLKLPRSRNSSTCLLETLLDVSMNLLRVLVFI